MKFIYYINKAVVFTALFFLYNCSCQNKINRLANKCGNFKIYDTLKINETVFTRESFKDTTFYFNTSDTVILKGENFITKYFYKDSLIYLNTIIEKDTIFINKEIPINKIELKQNGFRKHLNFILITLAIIFLLILIINYSKK